VPYRHTQHPLAAKLQKLIWENLLQFALLVVSIPLKPVMVEICRGGKVLENG
jgi:hypothetical protein